MARFVDKTYMHARDFGRSSFLSCEKDFEIILKRLFVESKPYSDTLKKLLVINNKDCLSDSNVEYDNMINEVSLASLIERGHIATAPHIGLDEHSEVQSYLIFEFNNFIPNSNPEYRDCVIDITILCNTDNWDLGNYQMRPIKIMGYIDGILNGARLSGLGELEFLGANMIVLSENLSGYLLRYQALHGSDDSIPNEE